MAKAIEEYEFPCGLYVRFEMNTGILDLGKIEHCIERAVCPIHGRECKRRYK